MGLGNALGLSALTPELDRVRATIHAELAHPDEVIEQMLTCAFAAGGKAMRPGLALMSYFAMDGCGQPASTAAVELAAAIEILHVGTLHHDDVMDHSDLRRGKPTSRVVWGDRSAVAIGSTLLGKSTEIASRHGLEFVRLMAACMQQVCRGQKEEFATLGRLDRTERQYFSAVGGKTAFLIAAAAIIGPMLANRPDATSDMWAGAYHLGVGFQIVDDLLDLFGSPETIGKPAGNDLNEGVLTLPTILLGPKGLPLLSETLGRATADKVDAVRDLVRRSGALKLALRRAERCASISIQLFEAGAFDDTIREALLVATKHFLVDPIVELKLE